MEHPHDPRWSAATPPPYHPDPPTPPVPPVPPGVPPEARPVPVMPLGGYPDGRRPFVPAPLPAPVAAPAPFAPAPAVGTITASIVAVSPARRAGAVLAVLGAAALAFGTFMPWITADISSTGIVVGNGWQAAIRGTAWGPVFVLVALVVAVAVASPLAGVPAPSLGRLGVGAAAAGVAAAGFVFFDLFRGRAGVEVDLELGPFVMLSGALLALVGATLAARSASPANVTAPRAVGAVG